MFAVKENLSVGNFKKIQPEEATLYTIKGFGFLQRTFKNIQSKTERTYTDNLPIQILKIPSKILIKFSIFYILLDVQVVRFTHVKEKHRNNIFTWLVADSHNSVSWYSSEYYSTNISQTYLLHLPLNLYDLGSRYYL
jgi:hypothetical protein